MEHIVQFGVNIDDESIKKGIIRSVEQQVSNQIRTDVMRTITGRKEKVSDWEYNNKMKELIEKFTSDFLEENKEIIIEKASLLLSDKLSRTKAVKKMVTDLTESLL